MPIINNASVLVGNVTRDPELKYTQAGKAVTNFGIAYNTRRKNQATNEWEDGDASFFDISCWDQLAENVAETITKGTKVIVVGELRQHSWETDKGEKRSKVEVSASTVGPCLDWATAEIVRNERSSEGSSRSQGSVRRPTKTYDEEAPF
jgi:single-strand DNA-binding protein